jgi:hypothetical protein
MIIKNNISAHRKALKNQAVQLVLSMVELQLKYLFYILKKEFERDFDKALKGYTSIFSNMEKIPQFTENDEEWISALESVKRIYMDFSDRANGNGFARESIKILAPFLSYSALIPEIPHKWFGCFRYNYVPEKKHIYLHFRNACIPESPFASIADRSKELALIIKDIKCKGFTPETIGCDSWLNELKAFQKFFPSEYINSFVLSPPDSKSGYGWWGQFIGRDGLFSKSRAEKFAGNMDFQYKRLIAQCPYELFVKHLSDQSKD